jgi:hypothetical protein
MDSIIITAIALTYSENVQNDFAVVIYNVTIPAIVIDDYVQSQQVLTREQALIIEDFGQDHHVLYQITASYYLKHSATQRERLWTGSLSNGHSQATHAVWRNYPRTHKYSHLTFASFRESSQNCLCECRRVWRVLAKLFGECRRVWRVSHISEKGHFGECKYSPKTDIFGKHSHLQNLHASIHC